MCILGCFCLQGNCVQGGNQFRGCVPGGASGCLPCSVALMASSEPMMEMDGKYVPPEDSLCGVVIDGVGWKLRETGKTGLPIGTLVITISEDNGPPYPANDKWFDSHFLDWQSGKPASRYALTILRPDSDRLEVFTITRQ